MPSNVLNYLHSYRKIKYKKIMKWVYESKKNNKKTFNKVYQRFWYNKITRCRELLKYDHLGGSTLFEDNGLKKDNNAEILQELEKKLEKDDYRIYTSNYTNTRLRTSFQLSERFHWINLVVLEMLWSACGTWW